QGSFASFQIPYSGLERTHENVISRAAASGAGVIVRGGVARGEPGSGLGGQDKWDIWRKAGLEDLLEEEESPTAFLLRFTISHPGMTTTIVGTKNPAHLAENMRIADRGPLSDGVYAEAKKRLDAAGERPE
ncbi:MAG: aldo/keto reductase, partial [Spirochaetales bacterium]